MEENEIMIDFETFGTRRGSVIRSIGAVAFNLNAKYDTWQPTKTFYMNVCDKSCEMIGLTKDPSTVVWWSQQSKEAQQALLVDQVEISVAADRFNKWLRQFKYKKIWAQGANFDPMLWEAVCEALNISVPWKFYDCRDTRTIYQIGGEQQKTVFREGTYHNALDDACHQVRCVLKSLSNLRRIT